MSYKLNLFPGIIENPNNWKYFFKKLVGLLLGITTIINPFYFNLCSADPFEPRVLLISNNKKFAATTKIEKKQILIINHSIWEYNGREEILHTLNSCEGEIRPIGWDSNNFIFVSDMLMSHINKKTNCPILKLGGLNKFKLNPSEKTVTPSENELKNFFWYYTKRINDLSPKNRIFALSMISKIFTMLQKKKEGKLSKEDWSALRPIVKNKPFRQIQYLKRKLGQTGNPQIKKDIRKGIQILSEISDLIKERKNVSQF
ncbi:MAG: hypothetical protein H7A23_21950 [Leptospiraceae bacterium]|nr:hypothetical protein [Leptospiraceae bacterium]MCP5497225.1 hypothetical protein [Leptospiraceae bacterium]